jgi:hypothetical protein
MIAIYDWVIARFVTLNTSHGSYNKVIESKSVMDYVYIKKACAMAFIAKNKKN